MLGALISLMVTLFVVLPIKLFVVAPLQTASFLMAGGAKVFVLLMKGFGWVLWVALLPLRLL